MERCSSLSCNAPHRVSKLPECTECSNAELESGREPEEQEPEEHEPEEREPDQMQGMLPLRYSIDTVATSTPKFNDLKKSTS